MEKEKIIVAVSEYLEKCKNVWGIADNTIQARTEAFDLFFNKYEGELTLESFEGFVAWLKARGNTVQTIVARCSPLRLFIKKFAVRKGLCEDFTPDIKLPTIYHGIVKVVPIEDAERAIILGTQIGRTDNKKIQAHKREAVVALRFCLRTGLRMSELLNLKPDDIFLEEGMYWVDTTKSHRREAQGLPMDMIEDIKQRMKKDFIFGGITQQSLNGCLHRGSKKAGLSIRLHLHSLRAIFCTTQLKNKQPLQIVKALMRHADFSSLGKYSFAEMDDMKMAINTNPIVREGLSTDQIIQLVKDAINSTGVSKDKRIQTNTIESIKDRKFTFTLQW